jgi:mannitol-1-phosphate 5-dehydrogenase
LNKTALIFGAGKTGRGFAAHLAFLSGFKIILIDKNRQLVGDLKRDGQYDIQILGNNEMSCTIKVSGAYHIEDAAWHDSLVTTSLAFTSVFGNNLHELASDLAKALQKRCMANPHQVLTIITCENLANAAALLGSLVLTNLGEEYEEWLSERVGFAESIIFKTCLNAAKDQPPLTIRGQNFFRLPCDADAMKEELAVYGLEPLKNFSNQLRRKIYTYNCINAVIVYLGAKKGYSQLHEAGNDEEIVRTARKAAKETADAQVAEYHFDRDEQEEWTNAAFLKFSDKNIPDPIERNAADPVRKLGRDDRLIGPALLALKHGIHPEGLLAGIMACFDYRDANTRLSVTEMIHQKGANCVLNEVCGLSQQDELFVLIQQLIIKSDPNDKT